jgi:hypothetical protein
MQRDMAGWAIDSSINASAARASGLSLEALVAAKMVLSIIDWSFQDILTRPARRGLSNRM